jgi:hypothetical protein
MQKNTLLPVARETSANCKIGNKDAVFGYFYAYRDVGKGREQERKLWREKSYLRTYVQDVR